MITQIYQKDEEDIKINLYKKGKNRNYKWITNNVDDKFHNTNEEIPDGWRLGKCKNLPPRRKNIMDDR